MNFIRPFATPIVLLIVLLVVAVVGYSVYSQSTSSKVPTTPSPAKVQDKQVSPPNETSQSTLTADQEREFLRPLPADAPNEDKNRFSAQIASLAQDGTQLSLGAQCRPSPLVLRTKLGSELVVTNRDDTSHTLLIADREFTVDKVIIIPINTDLFRGDMLYRYSCDKRGFVGYLIIKQ